MDTFNSDVEELVENEDMQIYIWMQTLFTDLVDNESLGIWTCGDEQ